MMEFIECSSSGLITFKDDKGELHFSESNDDIQLIKQMMMQAVRQRLELNDDDEVTNNILEDASNMFHAKDQLFLVYTEEEIKHDAIERLKENIHYYSSAFLHDVFKIKLPMSVIDTMKQAPEQDANDACHAMMDDWEEAVRYYVMCDGYGSLFGTYDGESHEATVELNNYSCDFIILRIE